MNPTTYKLCLIGDGGVGKTTLLKQLLTGKFEKKYVATLGVEVHPITFQTSIGDKRFNVWDCAGQEKFGGLKDGYYIMADCAIVMFDVTSRLSFKQVTKWMNDFKKVRPDAPIVVVGNKVDITNSRKVYEKDVFETLGHEIIYYEISVKNSKNHTEPFLRLLKKLENDPFITLLPSEKMKEEYITDDSALDELQFPDITDTF